MKEKDGQLNVYYVRKSKRVFDKLGLTSNFTRHARENIVKEAFDI